MNRAVILFILFLISVCSLKADHCCETPGLNICKKSCFSDCFQRNTFEIRGAAFFHSSKRFREVYDHVGPSVQVEASTSLCDCFGLWTNFDFFTRARKFGACCRSRVNLYNLSLGAQYVYPFCKCVDIYAGIGPSFTWIDLKNKSCCGHDNEHKCAIGGLLKTGVYYYFCRNFFADVFVDYLYQPVHFHHRFVNVGGFKVGLGLGVVF